MTPERRHQIETVYKQALERDPGKRLTNDLVLFAVGRGGSRFLIPQIGDETPPVTVYLNWMTALKRNE
jgi:hypothetical protein